MISVQGSDTVERKNAFPKKVAGGKRKGEGHFWVQEQENQENCPISIAEECTIAAKSQIERRTVQLGKVVCLILQEMMECFNKDKK